MPRTDPRIRALRAELKRQADAEHAAFHRGYHKSELAFYGLKTGPLRAEIARCFPARDELDVGQARRLSDELWSSRAFEERFAALSLLERVSPRMRVSDLAYLKRLSTQCNEWVLLDHLACNALGHLALERGPAIYRKVRGWSGHRHMWTRRASILVHVRAARSKRLFHETAWDTFEERLFESEFFIRKAIGWALRECSKHDPQRVHAFLVRVGDRASGLTRREGSRNLPENLRATLDEG